MTAFAITMSIALVLIAICWAIAWRDAVRMQCDRDKQVAAAKMEREARVDFARLEADIERRIISQNSSIAAAVERVADVEKAQFGAARPDERRSGIRRGT